MPAEPGRCLGLIGGLGPGATIHYYRELIAAHQAQGRIPRLLIAHADVNRALALAGARDFTGLARYLAGLIESMAAGGAELTAMVAVTPHICAEQLVALSPLPLVDMVAEVANAVHARNLKRIALLGTRFTIETRMFGRLGDVEVVMPRPDEIDQIHNTYVDIVGGRGSAEQVANVRKLAHTFIARDGAEAVLMAGTDFSLVFNESNIDFPTIDCARVHIDAIVRRQLG
jgi:aspartate racemase